MSRYALPPSLCRPPIFILNTIYQSLIVRKYQKGNYQRLESDSNTGKVPIENTIQVIENEIECPRCYEIMTLCSDFDSLYYICESCDFYLYTIKR